MRASLGRIRAVAVKELRQLRRDRLTLGMVVGIPILQLLLFGYAINTDVRHLRAAVADQAGSQASRWLVADAAASQVVDVVARVDTPEELEVLLRRGEVGVGILLPPDFDRRLRDPGRPAGQLLVDAGDPTLLQAARPLADIPRPAAGAGAGTTAVDAAATLALRPFYNPERRSAVQIVPGLIGVILTMTMTLFTAVAITRERERGNLELLITTPIKTPELMAGKILPYVGIGLIQATLILSVGWLLFRVPVRGSLLDLGAVCLAFICAALTLGLLISTLAQTQFQAFQLTFFSFLPQILLSGFMFPFDGMPRPAQWLAQIFPLTHMLRLVRGILLRGAPTAELLPSLWPLGVFFLVTASLAIARFRKRLA
ncbi:MAG: ABC transporter permease [Thermoanaerobaculia bacterium]